MGLVDFNAEGWAGLQVRTSGKVLVHLTSR